MINGLCSSGAVLAQAGVTVLDGAAKGAPKLEVKNVSATDTGEKGNDGSPKLTITVELKTPIPAGYTKTKIEICTYSPKLRCWAQGAPKEVKPGDKSVTFDAWVNHSLDFNAKNPEKGEHALIKINNPATKQTIMLRVDVDIPGDF